MNTQFKIFQNTGASFSIPCLQKFHNFSLITKKVLLFAVFFAIPALTYAVGPALDVISSDGLVMIGKNDPNDTSDTQHKLLLGGGGLWSISGSKNASFIIGKAVGDPPVGSLYPTTSGLSMINITSGSVMIDGWGYSGNTLGFRHKLAVNGSIGASNIYTNSDKRYKREIEPISNLDNLFKINAVQYKSSGEAFAQQLEMLKKSGKLSARDLVIAEANTKATIEACNNDNTIHYGFIAQELREVYPELVAEDSDGFLSINYTGFIPILVDLIKTQQNQIKELKTAINELKRDANSAAKIFAESKNVENSPWLYQNNPNPFNDRTEIKYYIPSVAISATICVYDLNGSQILKMDIRERESGSISINAKQLKAGMYLYTLFVDGKEVDTKKMILTGE